MLRLCVIGQECDATFYLHAYCYLEFPMLLSFAVQAEVMRQYHDGKKRCPSYIFFNLTSLHLSISQRDRTVKVYYWYTQLENQLCVDAAKIYI